MDARIDASASASADIASNKDDNTQSDTNNTSNGSNGGIDAEIEKYDFYRCSVLVFGFPIVKYEQGDGTLRFTIAPLQPRSWESSTPSTGLGN